MVVPMRPGTREHPGETALRASWTRVKILYFFLKWERDYGRPMDIYDLVDGRNGLPASSLPRVFSSYNQRLVGTSVDSCQG